jgi:hypothetical protein
MFQIIIHLTFYFKFDHSSYLNYYAKYYSFRVLFY